VSITTLRGVQLWLAEDHIATCTSEETQRIREAVAVLSRPKPRKEDLRPLRDCNDWLNGLSQQDIAENKPVQRLQSATTLLQGSSSRQQRQEIQKLLEAWDVPQKAQGWKRKYEEVKADLVAKVVEEGHRLQILQDASATDAPAHFSAICEALQHASIPRLG